MGKCNDCKWWKRLSTDTDGISFGRCNYQIKFPESTYARSSGLKRNMREDEGITCECFEEELHILNQNEIDEELR